MAPSIQNLITNRTNQVNSLMPADTPVPSQPIDIQAELANIMQANQQQPQQQSALQTILGALSKGIGTGLSADPGGAVLQQIKDIQQQKNIDQDRADRQSAVANNFKLQELMNRVGEERRVREEQRAEARDISKETRVGKAQQAQEVRQFDYQKQLDELRNNYKLEELNFNKTASQELEALRSSNNVNERKFAALYETAVPLLYSGYASAEDAQRIFDKLDNGEKLDSKDQGILSKANRGLRDEKFRQERSLRAMSQGGGQGGGFQGELLKLAINKATTNTLYEGGDGQIYEANRNPLTGQPELPAGVQIKRQLPQVEAAQYYMGLTQRLVGGMQQQTPQTVSGTSNQIDIQGLIPQAQEFARKGMPNENIIKGLQASGVSQEVINQVMSKIKSREQVAEDTKASRKSSTMLGDLFKTVVPTTATPTIK